MKVGFIGLGMQGAPMARRVVEEGHDLTIWARRPSSLEPFKDTAASIALTPADLGSASDIVEICVFADADVEDVVLRSDGVLAGMSPGGLVAIHSTVHPRTCERVAERAAAHGVSVLDAPVSGSAAAAANRHLLVMTGGDRKDVERCRPVFETFGNPIVHVGPLGSGQLAKAMNNLLLAAHLAVAIDAFDFAEALGVDRVALAQVLAHGSGGSRAVELVAASGFDADQLRRGATPYFRKDLGIMGDVAEDRGIPQPQSLVELAHHTLVGPE